MQAFLELGWPAWATLVIVVVTLVLLLWERWSPDRVMLASLLVLMGSGILAPTQALAGFWNQGVLTVALLFVLVAALKSTGAIAWIGRVVIGNGVRRGPVLARVMFISSGCSTFINNTPLVATMTSALEHWCRRSRVSPSKVLLPMNYATILGGMCTMLGTSTNLIVGGLALQAGLPRMNLFAPFAVAFPALLIGLLYLLVFGHRLLPNRRSALDLAAGDTREYAVEMLVREGGELVGKTIAVAGLRHLVDTYLVELHRHGTLLSAVGPDVRLEASDRLVFVGATDGVRELRQIDGLAHATDRLFTMDPAGGHREMVELVLSSFSPAVGSTLRGSAFRERHRAAVLAISRGGRRIAGKLGDVELQAGDTLLAETDGTSVLALEKSGDFLLATDISQVRLDLDRPKAGLTLAVLAGMVLTNAILGVDMLWSALGAAGILVACGCVRLAELRRSADVRLLVVIASSFALGAAIQDTGLATWVAAGFGAWTGHDPFWTLVVLYIATVLFTELLTNNAAAVLMFPIALSAAGQLGVDPMPFIIAVMMGASAGFMTPIGYQTNLMVYGPGGYRFTDYLRVGAPLSVLVGVTVVWGIARAWTL